MIIKSDQLELRSIQLDDLEMIRQWRNSPEIRQYMEYQEVISAEMQKAWFEKVQASSDYYFVISYYGKKVGMIHLRITGEGQADSGLFIGEKEFHASPVGYWASLPLLDFGFHFLGLDLITAKVHRENQLARKYNESLGFVLIRDLSSAFQEFQVSPKKFTGMVERNKAFSAWKGKYSIEFDEYFKLDQSKHGLFISHAIL